MNMLIIIGPEGRQEEIQKLVAENGAHAYSELRHVRGEGKTGKKLGTHVWPEQSVLIFTVVDTPQRDRLVSALKRYQKGLYPEEGLKVFVTAAESVL